MISFIIFHWYYYVVLFVLSAIFSVVLSDVFHNPNNTKTTKNKFIRHYFLDFLKIFIGGSILLSIFIICFADLLTRLSCQKALLSFAAIIIWAILVIYQKNKR